MADEITKDRSPRSPVTTVEDSITLTRKLFDQIRTATVSPEVACKAIGYSGPNGAAMATLATLGQYGLVDRSKGKVAVTPLAIRILHPKSPEQRESAIRESALNSAVMNDLYSGFLECSETVIEGHLIQNGFTPDRARKVASIHTANKSFAKLTPPQDEEPTPNEALQTSRHEARNFDPPPPPQQQSPQFSSSNVYPHHTATPTSPNSSSILAQYSIPLGANQATLVFTGGKLTLEDFDALIDFVTFTKRQFERASGATKRTTQTSAPRSFPIKATWNNKDHDVPVTLVAEMGSRGGITYYQSENGTGIPGNELTFDE